MIKSRLDVTPKLMHNFVKVVVTISFVILTNVVFYFVFESDSNAYMTHTEIEHNSYADDTRSYKGL